MEPLTEAETANLVADLIGDAEVAGEVSARVAEAAEGNPLFVEEMVAMLIDDGYLVRDGHRWVAVGDLSEVKVPPTVHALIAARLDRLVPVERAVLERAAIVGNRQEIVGLMQGNPRRLASATPTINRIFNDIC